MRKLYFLASLLFVFSSTIFAQSGKISGKIINASSGRALDGATVTLTEKSKSIKADQNGEFAFNKLEAGTYSIKFSYVGHIEKIVDEIVVKNNDNTFISISLDQKKSDAVIVTATRIKAAGETVASLLVAQKNSANVSDGITAQQIKLTPDKYTSDVIKRVSGASIQDDRFAVIRGLNDRYNAAFINGAPLPSTESDRKAFAFDIFPSAILDNLVIYKTATPDRSGDFAGGIIEITTKSIPAKNFTTFSFGTSYNTLLTGKERYFSENKSKTDWLGIDDGLRATPSSIPNLQSFQFNDIPAAERAGMANLYKNFKWGIKRENSARPNYNFQLTKGINIQRKQQDFIGALFSVNYNRTYTIRTGQANSFEPVDFDSVYVPNQIRKYRDSIYNDEVVVSALGNIAVKINNRNSISWKNNYSINTDNKLLIRSGNFDFYSDTVNFAKDLVRFYTSNQIFTSQLTGEHTVGKYKTKINWLAGYTKLQRDIPNQARTAYTYSSLSPNDVTAQISTSPLQTYGNGVMFSSKTNENSKSIKVDITQPYTFMKNTQNSIKIGVGYQARERDFISRAFALSAPRNLDFDYSLDRLPEDQIFLPGHFGKLKNGKWGFVLYNATLPSSDYSASSTNTHAYVMNDQRFFKKFRLIYGLRMEKFNQKLNAFVDLYDTVNVNQTVTDYLPSANFVYALTPKTNIRLSYATTINRPEYRELAPFLFYDDVSGISVRGTSELKRALINNYDFRYEYFPGKAQLLSFSAFYKKFKNPIELVIAPNTSSLAGYINSTTGYVYGIEAEFRVLLSTLLGIKNEDALLSKFTLSANGAYMKSNVRTDSFGSFNPADLLKNHPLQGQSPYIINTSLSFNHEKLGLSSTLSANRIGDRLAIVGSGGRIQVPNIYEKARTVIDFQLTKFLMKNAIELKLNIKDLLAQDLVFYNDYDRNKQEYSKERDINILSSIAPRVISINATIKL
jgi:TonB-dependent receptor